MKRLDRLVISSFIPPFAVAFTIAMFVLVMQMLWLYIDDIAGKGLGAFAIIELLSYRSVSIIPMALPLGMLIASVMVMGGMAEHYELSSIKSAGVSLTRVMRPLMFVGVAATLFSMYCSNTLIPISNLKFGSRMFDIQQKKPALSLEAGAFNYDFQGYAIHIGKKEGDGKSIHDVLIYDHTETNAGKLSQIIAESGEMFSAPDGSMFVMKLQNGYQYVEERPRAGKVDGDYPFVRTGFKTWVKVFDLQEFELSRTNEELFKSNRQMMSSKQLNEAIDSISIRIDKRRKDLSNYTASYFQILGVDSTYIDKNTPQEVEDSPLDGSGRPATTYLDTTDVEDEATGEAIERVELDSAAIKDMGKAIRVNRKPGRTVSSGGRAIEREMVMKNITDYESHLATFPSIERPRLLSKAKTFARSILNQAESANRSLDRMRESRVKHIYDLHMKYSMAVVCFIFLFIGAPMGAIVRKGGFGFPILISIIFFMLFVVLTIFCRKIAESYVVPAIVAAWLPCGILFPIGIFLTIKAMNDSQIGGAWIITFFQRLFSKKEKKPTADATA